MLESVFIIQINKVSDSRENKSSGFELTTQRLEAFSDGVFAIAITLLILEVKIPEEDDIHKYGGLKNFLLALWPSYFAYVFSFLVIGIYWANHHYLFHFFKRTDHVFNLLNIFFLMCIAFLPYPAAILGDYIADESQRSMAVTLYALGIFLPAFSWLIMWLYSKHNYRIIDRRLAPAFIKTLTRQYYLSNLLYITAIIVSLFSPVVSLSINVGLTLLYLVPPRKPEYKSVED